MKTKGQKGQFGAIKGVAILALAIMAASCAQPARPSLMSAPNILPAIVGANPTLQQSVTVNDVTGGKETNPLWTSQVGSIDFQQALERSLQNSVLLATIPSEANFVVSAQMLELKQPLIGASLTVTSRVSYHVMDRATSEVFMNEEVVTPYTANFSSALYAVERLRLANEGAIRVNIGEFVKRFIEQWARSAKKPASSSGRPTS